MAKVLVPFTTGVEEIEMVAVVDILRRADIEVCMASLDGKPVTGRSNITIHADAALAEVASQAWDMIVLPGGLPNAHLLRDNALLQRMVQQHAEKQAPVAAICAAPTALAKFGVTEGKKVTSYPSVAEEMQQLQPSSVYVEQAVVEDDFLITSRGAGTAVAFALRLVAKLKGNEVAENIRISIVA